MYKNILVAIDDSNASALALKEAINLVKEHPECILRIIHVVNVDVTPFYVSYASRFATNVLSEHEKTIKNSCDELLKKTKLELHKANILNFETKLIEMNKSNDRISQKIVDEAKLWPANLIIIGTHGRRGLNHLFIGSVTEKVANSTTVPVLLIHGSETL